MSTDAPTPPPEEAAPKPSRSRTAAPSEAAVSFAATSDAPSAAAEGYVSARRLMVTGDAGPEVAELAKLLAAAGYDNPIARGEAPAVLDDAMMRLIRDFQADNDHDPARPESPDQAIPLIRRGHAGIVDARTWELLLGERQEVTR